MLTLHDSLKQFPVGVDLPELKHWRDCCQRENAARTAREEAEAELLRVIGERRQHLQWKDEEAHDLRMAVREVELRNGGCV